jgi:hypothetical protein
MLKLLKQRFDVADMAAKLPQEGTEIPMSGIKKPPFTNARSMIARVMTPQLGITPGNLIPMQGHIEIGQDARLHWKTSPEDYVRAVIAANQDKLTAK